jgi:gluconokinase
LAANESERDATRNRDMVIVLMGVCGCGKTTVGQMLAAELGWPFYEADAFHPASNVQKMSRGEPLTDADRRPWLSRLAEVIRQHIDDGSDAVLACSALTVSARDTLAGDGEGGEAGVAAWDTSGGGFASGGGGVVFVYLKGDKELIRQRMRRRVGHFMPASLVDSQFATLEEPHDAIVVDVADPPEVIVAAIRDRLGV